MAGRHGYRLNDRRVVPRKGLVRQRSPIYAAYPDGDPRWERGIRDADDGVDLGDEAYGFRDNEAVGHV